MFFFRFKFQQSSLSLNLNFADGYCDLIKFITLCIKYKYFYLLDMLHHHVGHQNIEKTLTHDILWYLLLIDT